MQHFWIVGTDTDVGKTFVTATMLRQVQALGYNTMPYKPVQTGEVEIDGKKRITIQQCIKNIVVSRWI